MERVLVTGASGFVGRHVMALLRSDARFEVIGTARRPGDNIQHSADLTQPADAAALIDRSRPDAIIHAAGARHGSLEALIAANVTATRNLLDAAGRIESKPRIVMIGSAAEYGIPGDGQPIRETDACDPKSPYGRSKLDATLLALDLAGRAGLNVAVLRLFNVVGPGMGGLPGDVVRQIRGTGPKLDWDEERRSLPMVRDFVGVGDVAEACRRTLLSERLPPVINICTGHGRTFSSLLTEMAALAGVELDHPQAEGIGDRVVGDPTLCERNLGFRPSSDIADALSMALAGGRKAA